MKPSWGYTLFVVTMLSFGCSKASPSDSERMFDQDKLCESAAQEGKYSLTAKRLTIIFEGIPIGDDGKKNHYRVLRLVTQEPGHSHATTLGFGSTEVVHKLTAGKDGTTDIQINDYKLRLVEDGKALEIDGKTYKFDDPQTIIISKDGKATTKARS
jgi:hypothetical protein